MGNPKDKTREGDQPLPIPNDHIDIQSMVMEDIKQRREVGIQRYGTALQPHNGRDALQDAYEEAIDLTMYLKQLIVERDSARATSGGVELTDAKLDELADEAERGYEPDAMRTRMRRDGSEA